LAPGRASLLEEVVELLPVCAWCDRCRLEDDAWTESGDYPSTALVTHTICPACEEACEAEAHSPAEDATTEASEAVQCSTTTPIPPG